MHAFSGGRQWENKPVSLLKIFDDSAPSVVHATVSEPDEIGAALNEIGVRFERWQTECPLERDASQEAVLAAYRTPVEQLMAAYAFRSVDVIALTPDHPEREALRAKFLQEHTHSDFEVRFFVAGRGLFYIHAADKVYGVMCEAGDLISVPADARHWFDMGAAPDFRCIRLFTSEEGWVANYTGDNIAATFPTFEQFCR